MRERIVAYESQAFEALLQTVLPELPPDGVVKAVTPWRKAIRLALSGLALTTVTLNFWGLNYLFPAAGVFLLLLGFRALRRENGWFRTCWICSVFRAVFLFPALVAEATFFRSSFFDVLFLPLSVINVILTFLLISCLLGGFRAVRGKVGLPKQSGAAAALFLWYLLLCLLGFVRYEGIFFPVCLLAAYGLILRSLFKLSRELDEAGYTVRAAKVRVPDWLFAALLAAGLLLGILLAYTCGNRFPMDWKPVSPVEEQTAGIQAHLEELGFPRDVLEDLTGEELLSCKDARQVVTDRKTFPVNRGRTQVTRSGDIFRYDTVYDVKELCVTEIAVELSGERHSWKFFHHFRFAADPGFAGTECICLFPASQNAGEWTTAGEVTGRLLCSIDGKTFSSPYYSLQEGPQPPSIFGGENDPAVYAEFSMPGNSREQRGYLTYTVDGLEDNWLVFSSFDYTHQLSRFQYPVLTAGEYARENHGNDEGVFITAQSFLRFHIKESRAELLK